MKTTIKHFAIIAALPLLCMCAKDNAANTDIQETVTVTASVPDVKVSLTPGQDPALALAWESTDQLLIAGTNEQTFSVKSIDEDAHRAIFEGNAVSGSSFTVYYPADKGILERSYASQIQDGNGSTAHLQFNALAEGLSDYQTIEFTKVNGAVKLEVKLPETVTAVESISVTAKNASGEPQSIFYATNNAEGEKTATLTIGFDDAAVPDGNHVVTAYMMVSWNPVELAAGTLLDIEAAAPGKTCKYVKTISVKTANTISGGETFIIDMSGASALTHVLSGKGTETAPYLLYDAEDMLEMNKLLVLGETKYFKMMADIDMKDISWTPENQASPYTKHIDFDGNNHKIINFTCTKSGVYPGLIGVLSGRVANVTFVNPVVSGNKHTGIVCGYAGSSGTKAAIVENVTITGGKVTQTANCHTGFIFGHSNVDGCKFTNITITDGELNQNGVGDSGFIGGAQNIAATFTNCHTGGTLTVKSGLAPSNGTSVPSGGIQGYSVNSTYTNCSFTGTLNGGRLCGGIVGYDKASGITISKCSVDATFNIGKHGNSSAAELCGGIAAWIEGGTVSECSVKGTFNCPKYVGGVVGQLKSGKVEKCHSTAEMKSGNILGGIVGYMQVGTTVDQCFFNGKIDNCKDNSGGIVGTFSAAGGAVATVSNCYSRGTITSGSQKVGGIAGEVSEKTITKNCYSTMSISGGGRVFGSIAGRANNSKWDGSLTTDFNIVVSNCIAAGSINSTGTDTGWGSSGAMLGNAPCKIAHYTNCWRKFGFSFQCAYSAGAGLVDQGYTVTSFTAGTWGGGVGGSVNWWPYHASEASAAALTAAYTGWTTSKTDAQITVSDIASAILTNDSDSWKSSVWDLSGDYPTLKNNPEPTE